MEPSAPDYCSVKAHLIFIIIINIVLVFFNLVNIYSHSGMNCYDITPNKSSDLSSGCVCAS